MYTITDCSSYSGQRCHWGKCLRTYDFCDGANECFDWSDEVNCGGRKLHVVVDAC